MILNPLLMLTLTRLTHSRTLQCRQDVYGVHLCVGVGGDGDDGVLNAGVRVHDMCKPGAFTCRTVSGKSVCTYRSRL